MAAAIVILILTLNEERNRTIYKKEQNSFHIKKSMDSFLNIFE